MSNIPTTTTSTTTRNIGGRPKGKKSKLGMTLKNRLKALKEVIESPNTKDSDRVMAVKTMTELMADKVVADAGKEASVYLIKFEEITDKPTNNLIDNDNTPANPPTNETTNMIIKQTNTNDEQTSQVLEVPAREGLINVQEFKPKSNVMLNSNDPTKTPLMIHNDTPNIAKTPMNVPLNDDERRLKQAKARLTKLRRIRDAKLATNYTNTPVNNIELVSNDAKLVSNNTNATDTDDPNMF